MYSLVVINAEHTAALRRRFHTDPDVVVFADSESLQAIERMMAERPAVIVMSRAFVATARGAGLVARLKSAELSGIDVRVLTEDENRTPLVLSASEVPAGAALVEGSRPIDRAGTRAALRYEMDHRPVIVNGEPGSLIDLSTTGAQLLLAKRVRPNEPVRLVLADQSRGDSRCSGKIVWAIAVPMSGAIHYRAGVQLMNPNTEWLQHYCVEFGGRPDHTFLNP
jgi:hypothetical protein